MVASIIVKFAGNKDLAPFYASEEAAGADLKAFLTSEIVIKPGERKLIPTGIYLEIPVGYEGQIRPRSGLAVKHGVTVLNSPGTIDSDYRGEVRVLLINHGDEDFTINPGDRIAQLIISPVIKAEFTYVEQLKNSGRGKGGFGSTGINHRTPDDN